MNYIVYKTTNIINGKIYIGVHKTKDPNIFDGYIGLGVYRQNDAKQSYPFHQAVRKYGYENFKREVIKIFPYTTRGMKQAYRLENKIVNEDFIKRDDTYNIRIGGLYNNDIISKKVVQYDLDGNFIKVWKSGAEARRELNISDLYNALNGKSKHCGGYQWRYYIDKSSLENIEPIKDKAVYQFDLQGNFIKVYKNIKLAAESINNNLNTRSVINNVCMKRSNSAYGYYWSYKRRFDYNNPYSAVAAYNDEGELLYIFNKLKDAAEFIDQSNGSNILSCIKGIYKHCKGYRWRYFYGNTSNIEPLNT